MVIDPKAAGFSGEKLGHLERHLRDHYIDPEKIPGCRLIIARRGIVAQSLTLGHMDRERGRLMRDDTIFRIYSMTKPITSIALMMLFEEGRFQLSDPVYKFIPSWRSQEVWVEGTGANTVTRPPKRPMTLHHLLTHTAGLTYGGILPGMDQPVDDAYRAAGATRSANEPLATFVQRLAAVPLLYDPGSQWSYSVATDVCGYLVELISGLSLAEFFRARIFEPLDMSDTGFFVRDQDIDRFAACYVRASDKSLRLQDDPATSGYRDPPAGPSGAGGLVSTLGDYSNFCTMLLQKGTYKGRQLISRPTLNLMTQNHLGNSNLAAMAVGDFSETSNEGVGFGLGFATTMDPVAAGTIGSGDFYWGGYASTLFWVDPIEDFYAIFMTQLIPSATFNFRGQLKNLAYGAIAD